MKKIQSPSPIKKRTRSFEEVLAKANTSHVFRREYDQELSRLKLAQQIRDARLAQKLTQKAVADRVGIPQSVVARAESGTHGISVDTLERIAYAFGKSVQLV